MMRTKHFKLRARDHLFDDRLADLKFCSVATAVIGSAIVGGIVSNNSSQRAAQSNDKATAAAANAASESEQTARDRLNFEKQVYSDGYNDRALASDTARRESAWQVEDRTKYNALQDEQIKRGKLFQGVENQMLTDSQNYDTESRRDQEAAKAMAEVNSGFSNVKAQDARALARMGINPSSGRSLAIGNQTAIAQASSLAGASNKARNLVETQGYARKMDAVGLGKGLIGNQATQAGLQLNAGNSSVTNAQVPLTVAANANNSMSNAYGNAGASFGNASNLFSNVAGLQARNFYGSQAYGRQAGQDMSSALMTGYGMYTGQYNPFAK